MPLIHEGQAFEALYFVSCGSFKCVQTDLEGYEQVLEFAIHGDLLGLDGLGRSHHASGAVALQDSAVVVLPFRNFMALSQDVPALGSLLLRATGDEVLRRSSTQYLMSAPRAEVRLARFLLQQAERQAAIGHSDRRLRLCMSRRDIASYLGVAHETVSRALGTLAAEACIKVSQRDIELTDLEALREVQRMTRGRTNGEAEHAGGGVGPRTGASLGVLRQPRANRLM
jgi:CRP/FNR family transcriptional regulator